MVFAGASGRTRGFWGANNSHCDWLTWAQETGVVEALYRKGSVSGTGGGSKFALLC